MLILVCSTISNIRLTNNFPNGLYNLSEGRRSFIARLFLGVPLHDFSMFKRAKKLKGYDEYEIVLILEQNIRVFLGFHKLTHGLRFGIIYFCKYYGQLY